MLACDWVGNSYSPSMMRTACLMPSSNVAVLALDRALDDRRLADVLVQLVVAGEIRLRVRPRHLEGLRGLDRVPFLLGDDREQVLDPDHLGARNILDRAFVDLDRHRAGDARADHAGMQHAGQPHVVDHLQLREHLAGRSRRGNDWPMTLNSDGFLSGALTSTASPLLSLAVPVHLRVEVAPADQLGIGDALAGVRAWHERRRR